MSRPVLEARRLVKHYGRVVAMDGVDFELRDGEILAVVGDNGAGKSTMIKALAGALRPDAGEIRLDGQPVSFRTPMEARNAGIESVFQNLTLSPALSIAVRRADIKQPHKAVQRRAQQQRLRGLFVPLHVQDK